MKFTRKTDYALRALQALARAYYRQQSEGQDALKPVSVQSISDQSRLSLRFLHSVVSGLSKKGLLRSVPGPRGGVSLAREPGSITILDIVEAVEGPIQLMECLEHPETCGDVTHCGILSVLLNAQDALVQSLRQTTLQLMVQARQDPLHSLPPKHYLRPEIGCPVLK
jgi:Rrf2 family protein